MLGVQPGQTGTLKLRKTKRGVDLLADPPNVHEFPRKFLEREINQAVRVYVTLPATTGLVDYEITRVTESGDLVGHKLPPRPITDQPKTKRKWWKRG